MENETLNRVFTSVRHHNYEAAIFQLSFTSFEQRDLLLGILYYFNGEYLRAINYLSEFKTKTSTFYTALSHIKNKDFKYATECFDAILSNQTLADTNKLYKEFYITNDEYIYELHADCLTQLNEREKALGKYLEAVQISALPKSCKNLMMENRSFTLQNCFPFEKSFFEDLNMYKATKNAGILQKYHGKLEYCLFFQSEAAKYLFEDGNNLDSLNAFNIVKRMDNLYFNNVDVYSTILWYNKDVDSLGFLCRKLVDTMPKASITWLALGNYFSLKADHERSIQCFKRSIIIASNHYSLTLLGHEYIIKQDYTLAAKYFTQSLKKYRNNYNACFGLGVVYTTMNKIENAEYYLKKAIKSNQNNLRLKYYMMQFYNRVKDYTRAIEVLCDVFGCNLQSFDVTKILADCNVDENREIILLESIDFFLYNDQENTCQYILENVRYRGKTYYQKKKLLNKTGE